MLRIEPRASHTLNMYSTIELHFQPQHIHFEITFSWVYINKVEYMKMVSHIRKMIVRNSPFLLTS